MSHLQRAVDPDRAGQVLLHDGERVGLLFWAHDFVDRADTLELVTAAAAPAVAEAVLADALG